MTVQATITDFLQTTLGNTLVINQGVWVRLHNNNTGTDTFSTAITGSRGDFTYSVVPGDYSLYFGPSATVGGTPTLASAHYRVAYSAGDDAALDSVTASSSSPTTQSALVTALGGSVSVVQGRLWVPQPSGDTTGATDTAAIEAVLSAISTYWKTIQATLVSPQYAKPFPVHFWPSAAGPYYLQRRSAADILSGGIFLYPGVSLVGDGTLLVMQDNTAHIRSYSATQSPLSSTVATLTVDVALGDYTVTVDSSAGFAVGNPFFARFGDHPDNSAETPYWLFGYIAAITDGTHLTFDRPVGTALTVAGVTNAVNKQVVLMSYELRDFTIDGFTFIQGTGGSANVEHAIKFAYARNFTFRNVAAVDPGAGFSHQFCENGRGENISTPHSLQQGGATSKGRLLEASESADITWANVQGANFGGILAFAEFSARRIKLDGVRVFVTNSPARTANTAIFATANGADMTVENLDVEGDGTNTTIDTSTGTGSVNVRYRNVNVNMAKAIVNGFAGNFAAVDGVLKMQGVPTVLNGTWQRVKQWSAKFYPKVNTASQDLVTPSGLYRAVRIYASGVTGITSALLRCNAVNGNNFASQLVAGQLVDVADMTGGISAAMRFGSNNANGNAGYTGRTLRIATDGTFLVGTELYIEIEYFAPPTGDDGSKAALQDGSLFANRVIFALTDAATVATDATLGDYFTLAATAGRTIGAPTNPKPGMQRVWDILNSSGGAMTTTWNAAFKLAGAWTDPASTKRRKLWATYDGTNWVEDARSAADI